MGMRKFCFCLMLAFIPFLGIGGDIAVRYDDLNENKVSTDPLKWQGVMHFLNETRFLELGSNPASPSTNKWNLFFKSDGLYYMGDGGSVYGPLGSTSSSNVGDLLDVEDLSWNQGDIFYFDGSNWTRLPPGTDGYYLETQGTGANPTWSMPSGQGDMDTSVYDSDTDDLIDTSAGGTELDTTSVTGIPRIDNGSWSVDKFFDLTSVTGKVISTGSIDIDQSVHTVDGEGGNSDELVTINNTANTRILYIWPENADREITLVHGTGNIITPTGANYTLPDNAWTMLVFDGTNWRMMASAGSGQNVSVDLGNDDSDESKALEKIKTQNDPGIVTEPVEDELLFDFNTVVSETQTGIGSANWVLNEDDFSSRSDTKVVTQDSVENRIQSVVGSSVTPNSSGFVETVIGSGNQGTYTSIDVDSDGHPHIVYKNESEKELDYAKWTGSEWVFYTVASDDAEYISMQLDSSDTAHIAYHANTNDNLKYASGSDGSFTTNVWDSTANTGEYTDLTLDSGGGVHVSYYDVTNTEIKYTSSGGGGTTVSSVSSGYQTSIKVDSGDVPKIAYGGVYADSDGGWSTTTVVSDSEANVLLIDSNDNPHIIYRDTVSDDLHHIKDEGGGWTDEALDTDGDVGYEVDAELASNDTIYASYREKGNGDLRYISGSDGVWSIYPVDTQNDTGRYTSIALTENNAVNISYYDQTEGSLRYAGAGKWLVIGSKYLLKSGDTMTGQLGLDNDSDIPPTNWPLRSSSPTSPTAGAIYADDGTNTSDGTPSLRIFDGTSWYDMGGGNAQDLTSSRSGSDVTVDISDGNGTTFTDNYEANTDDQNISGSGLSGTDFTIGIENGSNQIISLTGLNDELYGLIRYQSTAPSIADEVAYIDSDTDELKVYDSGSGSWVTVSGGSDVTSVSDLSDADSTSPSDADALLYNSSNSQYENRQITESDITNEPSTKTRDFSFTCPEDPEGDDVSIEVNIDNNQDFSSIEESAVSHSSETGWKVFTGTTWDDLSNISGTGIIPSGYQGNRVTYTFSNASVEDGIVYYVRFRVSDDGGSTWSDWAGETVSW